MLVIGTAPTPARADNVNVAGVTCSMVNGVYTCVNTPTTGGTQACVTDNVTGAQSCVNISSDGSGASSSGAGALLGQGLGVVQSRPSQSSSSGWLSKLTGWLAGTLYILFVAIAQLLKDLVTYLISAVLGIFSSAISALTPPDFLSQYSLGTLLGQTGAIAGFFMTQLNIGKGLAIVGAGYAFRLLRKFLTLFQW